MLWVLILIASVTEAILMSTHNMYFYGELTKIILELLSNTHVICSTGSTELTSKEENSFTSVAPALISLESPPCQWSASAVRLSMNTTAWLMCEQILSQWLWDAAHTDFILLSHSLSLFTAVRNEAYQKKRKFSIVWLPQPEDHWSCIAHLSAEDMLKSAVIEKKKFKNIESDLNWTKVNEWPWPLVLIKPHELILVDCIYQLLYHRSQ